MFVLEHIIVSSELQTIVFAIINQRNILFLLDRVDEYAIHYFGIVLVDIEHLIIKQIFFRIGLFFVFWDVLIIFEVTIFVDYFMDYLVINILWFQRVYIFIQS